MKHSAFSPDVVAKPTLESNSSPGEAKSSVRHTTDFGKIMDLQRVLLINLLFNDPEYHYPGDKPFTVDFHALFRAAKFPDVEIRPNVDDKFRLPNVLEFHCKKAYAFDFYADLFENHRQDRLLEGLLQSGFKAVTIRFEQREQFALLRSQHLDLDVRKRNRELRRWLNPLFQGEDKAVVPRSLVDTFLVIIKESQRLADRSGLREWTENRDGDLVLSKPTSDEVDPADSIKLYLFLRDNSANQELRDVIRSVIRGQDTLVPNYLLDDFLGAIDRLRKLEEKASAMNWVQMEGSRSLFLEGNSIDDEELSRYL